MKIEVETTEEINPLYCISLAPLHHHTTLDNRRKQNNPKGVKLGRESYNSTRLSYPTPSNPLISFFS